MLINVLVWFLFIMYVDSFISCCIYLFKFRWSLDEVRSGKYSILDILLYGNKNRSMRVPRFFHILASILVALSYGIMIIYVSNTMPVAM